MWPGLPAQPSGPEHDVDAAVVAQAQGLGLAPHSFPARYSRLSPSRLQGGGASSADVTKVSSFSKKVRWSM